MSNGERPQEHPYEHVKSLGNALLLDSLEKFTVWGPEGLTDCRETFILNGESIGENATYYLLRCDLSEVGLVISMGQYSRDEKTTPQVNKLGDLASEKDAVLQQHKAMDELVLISFFDVQGGLIDGLEDMNATETGATGIEIDKLADILQHPDLQSFAVRNQGIYEDNMLQMLTFMNHSRRDLEATRISFLRVFGENAAAREFANQRWHNPNVHIHDELTMQKASRITQIIERLRHYFS